LSALAICLIGLAAFIVLMAFEMPIAFAFALVGCIGVILLKGLEPGLLLLASAPITYASSGALVAIPLFVLMGQFVFQSGISEELYAAAYKWVGRLPGGLALATTLACTAFGACCGVSVAAAATMGSVAFPEMDKYRYSRRLSTGCIAAGGSLSCLIPPSVAFIVYGVLTESSVGQLFLGGIFPGLLLASLYLVLIYVMCVRNPALGPAGESSSWKAKLGSLKGVIGALILFLIVIGGLSAGVFSANEVGAIGAIGAFILAVIKRRMSFSALVGSLKSSILTTCFILTLYTGAMIFSNFLALGHFSSLFRDWINSLPFSHHAIMIIILFLYIPLGMFMDGLAMLLLTLPIVFPIVKAFGFDPVWFGIIITLLVEMALLSPPVGLNSYVVHGVTKVPLQDVFYGIAPFFGMMFLCLALLYAFPAITLFLPNTVGIGAR